MRQRTALPKVPRMVGREDSPKEVARATADAESCCTDPAGQLVDSDADGLTDLEEWIYQLSWRRADRGSSPTLVEGVHDQPDER